MKESLESLEEELDAIEYEEEEVGEYEINYY